MLNESQHPGCAHPVDGEPPIAEIGEVLQALADPMRLAIVRSLAASGGEYSCGAFGLPVTKPTLTHHFRTLRLAGLIGSRLEGTRKFIHLRRDDLETAYPGLLDSVLQARQGQAADTRS